MRFLVLSSLVLLVVAGGAAASEQRTTLGDIPRTFSHYLNAQEAALCRSNAATGGLVSYFLNPAAASEVAGVGGQATLRYNLKSRDYLPGGDVPLEATDDGLLFSQFVAVRTSGVFTFGFGYSCPSFRSVQITGKREVDNKIKDYDGEFGGSLRFFEAIAAARIGDDSKGGLGVSVGLVNLTEEATERIGSESLEKARLEGLSASYAIGFTFDATEAVTAGIGYRGGADIQVDGDYYDQRSIQGESSTQPVTSAGLRVRPTETLTLYAAYIREDWDRAKSSLPAYPIDTDGPPSPGVEPGGDEAWWSPFGEAISTAAVGGELDLAEGRVTLRAGYSQELGVEIDNAIVPERSIGIGGGFSFNQYSGDLALVWERFKEGGESGQMVNYGIYTTVGYEF